MQEPWWVAAVITPLVALVVWLVHKFTEFIERRDVLATEDRRLYLRAMQNMTSHLAELRTAESEEQADRKVKHVEVMAKVDSMHEELKKLVPVKQS